MKKLISIFLILFLLPGCFSLSNNYKKKKEELVSQGVYATNDSIQAKRYDLAKKYSNETVKIVPPPKKRVKIEPIQIRKIDPETGLEIRKGVIILPEEDTGDIIRINSIEYNKLISDNKKNKDIINKFIKGEEGWKEYSGKVEDQKRKDQEKISTLSKELEKKIGIFDMIKYTIMAILLIPLTLIILILIWLIKIIIKVFNSKEDIKND